MKLRRNATTNEQEPGSDSFLDVVANIVGILIILVIVVGVRVKHWQAARDDSAVQEALARLQRAEGEAAALERSNIELGVEAKRLAVAAAARHAERAALGAALLEQEQTLAGQRAQLDERSQRELELQQQVFAASAELDDLQRQKAQAASFTSRVETIETYPTPISRTVFGKEAHFQLRAGRIALVPMDELVERCMKHARDRAYLLRSQPELTDTVGPVGGFRLRYTLERQDVSLETQLASGGTAAIVRLQRFTLVPESTELGESLDTALAAGSELRAALARLDPRGTTITLWVYPESFGDFRALRKELYHLGYQVAGRPLPEGQPIGGSPDGSKSAAQ